jgi:hypothetical protein
MMSCGDDVVSPQDGAHVQTQGGQGLRGRAEPLNDVMAAGEERLRFTFTDAQGGPADPDALKVTPWMPHHGHGSTREPALTHPSPGVWEALVLFTMPGYLELQVQATYGGAIVPMTFGYEVQ